VSQLIQKMRKAKKQTQRALNKKKVNIIKVKLFIRL